MKIKEMPAHAAPSLVRIALVVLLLGLTSCDATAVTPKIELVPAFPNLEFDRPLFITHAGDGSGRLFVVEQPGRIHVFPDSADVEQTSIFLDISEKVRNIHNEEGLLCLAFHPQYKSNGIFFVWYSVSNPLRNVLARYRVSSTNPNQTDPASEEIILEVPKPYGNHNGSTLLFGPDGYLYLSTGDGGSAGDPQGNGQNLSALLGKILRLDVDHADAGKAYAIPPDNPYVGRQGARGEVWAHGLRNVWRMSFDQKTGELWAADVGQDKWEEIDLIVKGGNYGWNIREGRHAFRSSSTQEKLIDPVIEYGHDVGMSITGGYVYRGEKYPNLDGVYVYGDFITGTIWGMRYGSGKVIENNVLLNQSRNISSFGEDANGEILVTCFDGRVYGVTALK